MRGRVTLIAVVVALAGCKGTGTDPKPAGKDRDAPGTPAKQTKGPAWLDTIGKLPGANTGVPKADSWAQPGDPNFNVANEVKGVLAGRVLDPTGRGAKGVYIRVEPAGETATPGAALGILADAAGYFMAKGLKPNQPYTLTAEAQIEGKTLLGIVQARTPNPNLTIQLRDDVAMPPPGVPSLPPPQGGTRPEPPGTTMTLPPPANDTIPPMGVPASPAPAFPTDGAWSPGNGVSKPIPATLPPRGTNPNPAVGAGVPVAPNNPLPPPGDLTPPKPARPENVADGPKDPWKPPAANIPGPPVPTLPNLPTLPNPGTNTPGTPTGSPRSSKPMRPGSNFTLIDTLDRPWDFATSRYGSLVLLDFMTTTCVPCKKAIPVLADVQARFGPAGLQLVGVVCDDGPPQERASLAARYATDHNLNYALYVEPGAKPGAVQTKFGVAGYPTAVLLDSTGAVLWKGNPNLPGDKSALESAIRQHLGK